MAKSSTHRPKPVKSDVKDVTPSRRAAAFPHDREQTSPTRKDRRPQGAAARSDHVPRAVPRGTNELRGGRDRSERRNSRGARRSP